ncbi:MAG: SAM-dependent chlorinase/fluorinase [Thermodesulfobacteriota bacterium]
MLITLTTDFGLDDPFVAIMKGVILGRCPQASVVDICHTIPAQNIAAASHVLTEAAPYFPAATLHMAVVDPGVGTSRRIICIEASGQLFLAPDNGLLTPFFKDAHRAYELVNDEFFLQPVSSTFHGRDIFAPVAAALACGLAPNKLGPTLPISGLIHLEQPPATMGIHQLQGQCLRADHFGNMATNISKKELDSFLDAGETPLITIGATIIKGLSSTYGPEKGKIIALFNSSSYLEISIAGGNAVCELNLSIGSPVIINKSFGN